jgi:hypothetical protein
LRWERRGGCNDEGDEKVGDDRVKGVQTVTHDIKRWISGDGDSRTICQIIVRGCSEANADEEFQSIEKVRGDGDRQ